MSATSSAELTGTSTATPLRKTDRAEQQARQKKRTLLRALRQLLLALLFVGAAVGAVLALRPAPVAVDIAQVVRGPLQVSIDESGTTRVKDRYQVSATLTGRLSRVQLEAGDAVQEGDVLAEIAPVASALLDERTRAEAEARLSAAVSALGQAQALETRALSASQLAEHELVRARTLHAAGSLPTQALQQTEFTARMRQGELNSARFASKVAAEEVRAARVALRPADASTRGRHIDVLAPASGSVLRVQRKSAGVVQAGEPLIEVGNTDALEVVVDLLTSDAVHVRTNTQVSIEGWGGEQALQGRVRRVEPAAFTRLSALGVEEQRVNVLIELTDPRERWRNLGDGYHVDVRLLLWEANDVMKVPQGAVFRHGSGWATYRVDNDKAKLTKVQVGHRGEAEVEILAGLQTGQLVSVHPGDRVKDGVKVAPR